MLDSRTIRLSTVFLATAFSSLTPNYETCETSETRETNFFGVVLS